MMKILVIEDDPSLRQLYLSSLATGEFEIECVPNGKDGLRKILQGGYSVILLDVMLPEMDGLAVLTHLQSEKPVAVNGPIIIMTNLQSKEVTDKAISLGAKMCIDKTKFKASELPEKIKEWAS